MYISRFQYFQLLTPNRLVTFCSTSAEDCIQKFDIACRYRFCFFLLSFAYLAFIFIRWQNSFRILRSLLDVFFSSFETRSGLAHLVAGRNGFGSENVVVDARLPQPEGKRSLHENGPAGVVLPEELHLVGALDADDVGEADLVAALCGICAGHLVRTSGNWLAWRNTDGKLDFHFGVNGSVTFWKIRSGKK